MGTPQKQSYRVGVWQQAMGSYSSIPPYHPPALYPELAFCEGVTLDRSNDVYASVRSLFSLLDYDSGHRGSAKWNPLAWLIKPGDTVFVKPNLIAERHPNSEEWIDLITHGAVMRALIDYVFLALQGKGRIQVGDAPQTDSNITLLRQKIGIDAIQEFYRRKLGFEIEFLDLREEYWESKDGIVTQKHKLGGDPLGTVRFDLGDASYFAEVDGLRRRYYGAFYDVEETNRHHGNGVHEYLMARSPLAADVFISVPKMKTHKKVGVTLNLKGLVGITGDKNYLPHYALGSPEENGDQFPVRKAATVLENAMVGKAKRFLARGIPLAVYVSRKTKPLLYRVFGGTDETVRAGNWWGNDTCWRMTLDLNQLLLYGDPGGSFRSASKRYFSVVDGIIGMEGNGPVAGTSRPAGLLLGGENAAAVDVVTATIMGFDYRKLPLLHRSFDAGRFFIAQGDPADTQVSSNSASFNRRLDEISSEDTLAFKPHFGWTGRVELDPKMQPAVVAT